MLAANPFGPSFGDLQIPDNTFIAHMEGASPMANPGKAILESLSAPIASESLAKIAKGKKDAKKAAKAVIVVSDNTRPVPYKGEEGILMPVIDTLMDAGFKADEITTERVEFKFIQDTQSAMLEYQSGNLDVVKLTGEQVDAYKNEAEFTNRLEGYLWYLSINFTVDKFQNENLRKALALSIDRETIATNVLKDGSIAAEGLIPVALASDTNGVDFREGAGTITAYDPEAAAEYYEKAKEELGGDVTIDLLFEDTEASKAVAEYIQNNWETNLPGLTVTLNSKPKKTRLDLMNDQAYDICLTRWGPDYADPQTYLDLFISTNEANNAGRYNNADYDAKVLAGTSGEDATDAEARWQDFIDAEKIIVDTVGVIPVYQNGGAYMIKSNVKGVEFHSAGVDSFRNITVE